MSSNLIFSAIIRMSQVRVLPLPPYPNRGCKFDYLGKLELTEVLAMQFLVNISHSKVVELLSIVQLVGEPPKPKSGSYKISRLAKIFWTMSTNFISLNFIYY